MRAGTIAATSSRYLNKERALNDLLASSGGGLSSATLSSVNDSASSQTLLAANSDRKGFVIVNDSSAILYVAFAATASATAYTHKITPQSTLECFGHKNYTGVVSGIWASDQSGAAYITELEAT